MLSSSSTIRRCSSFSVSAITLSVSDERMLKRMDPPGRTLSEVPTARAGLPRHEMYRPPGGKL
jgi:hypothetical protein